MIRNTILENFELALLQDTPEKAAQYLNIVLVGGGPTGVELAGAIAEMKKYNAIIVPTMLRVFELKVLPIHPRIYIKE